MASLGVLLLLVWLVAQIFGVAVDALELILKLSLVLIAVGILLDFFTGFGAYKRFRK